MNEQIRKDLSRKLQVGLGALVERDMGIAAVVLSPEDTSKILLEAAVMMVRTVAASIASAVESPDNIDAAFDTVVEAVIDAAKASRDDSLVRIRASLRETAS